MWTGGHLVLALTILPRVLRDKSATELLRLEAAFEHIGLPALFIQVVSGVWLADRMMPNITQWFALDNSVSRLLTLKLSLLLITVILALDSRLRLIPKLSARNLPALAWHIIAVTVVSVLFVVVGVSFRTGWLV
jgi:putative copper export protein